MKLRLLTTLLVLVLAALIAVPVHAAPEKLVILHTNDLHGQIFPLRTDDGEVGGFPALAALLLRERARAHAAGARVLLTDAGDVFQGTPPGDLTKGEAVLPLYAKLGYQVATLGNHDYDIGEAALAERIRLFGCPLVCANLVRKATGCAPPYLERDLLLDLGGMKVGVTGLMAEDLHEVTGRDGVRDLAVLSAERALPPVIRSLRRRGAEVVIVISHCGFERDQEIAARVDGIDAIVGGHTHTPVAVPALVGRTFVTQTGGNSRHLARLELTLDPCRRRVARGAGALLPVLPAHGVNLAMAQAVEAAAGPILAPLMQPLGRTATPLVHVTGPINTPEKRDELARTIRERPDGIRAFTPAGGERPLILETNLAHFVCDAFREAAGVDLAVTNITGIRAAIPAGPIRRLEVYNVLPFDNTLVAMTLSGEDLRALFAPRDGQLPDRFLQLSGGRVVYRVDPATGRAALASLTVGGAEVASGRTYSVATNSFLAQGGDGYDPFLRGRDRRDTKRVLRDIAAERVERMTPLAVTVEPRVTVESGPLPAGNALR